MKKTFLLVFLAWLAFAVPLFKPIPNALPPEAHATFAHWLDYDNDGRPDLLLQGQRLFRNESTPGEIRFRETTVQANLRDGGRALCYDFDNDGWTDVATTKHLWHNRGDGTFEDVGEQCAFTPHAKTMTMAAGDLDGDGFPDLYLGMGEDWNNGSPRYYPAQLWLGTPPIFPSATSTGQAKLLFLPWREVSHSAQIDRLTYARSALILDIDGDGRQDLFVANYRLQPTLLWINQTRKGKIRFKDEARRRGVQGRYQPKLHYDKIVQRSLGPSYGHCIGACWTDFDNDGHPDLFVANLVHKYIGPSSPAMGNYDIRGYVCDDSSIYRNQGGMFQDWRARLGIPFKPSGGQGIFEGDELWSGCTAADFDNDSFEDVFVPQIYNLSYAHCLLFHNVGGTAYHEVSAVNGLSLIDSYCGTWADMDGDGLMDLVTAGRPQQGAPAKLVVFRNEGTPEIRQRAWLKVNLRPGRKGTALGAIVRLQANGHTLTRVFNAGSGTMGQQNDPSIHFGLGNATTAPAITVTWPDGHTSTHQTALRATTTIRNE